MVSAYMYVMLLPFLCTHIRVFPRPFTHGGDLSPHMGGQVQGDKALMGGLMRGDIDLMGRPNFDRLYHELKVLLMLSCDYMM